MKKIMGMLAVMAAMTMLPASPLWAQATEPEEDNIIYEEHFNIRASANDSANLPTMPESGSYPASDDPNFYRSVKERWSFSGGWNGASGSTSGEEKDALGRTVSFYRTTSGVMPTDGFLSIRLEGESVNAWAIMKKPIRVTGDIYIEFYTKNGDWMNYKAIPLEVWYGTTSDPGETGTSLDWVCFDTMVSAPNGFMIALSYYDETGYGFLGIANDLSVASAEYPFRPGTQYYSSDYTTGVFSTLESQDASYTNMMFIRASGIVTGMYGFEADEEPAEMAVAMMLPASPKAAQSYGVWRMAYGQENAEEDWVKVGDVPATDTTIMDEAFSSVNDGLYRYAVRTSYSDSRVSDEALSSLVGKNMDVALTMSLTTSIGVSAEGASVLLKSTDYSDLDYSFVWGTESSVDMSVIRGNYSVTVWLAGFATLNATAALTEDVNELRMCCARLYASRIRLR